MILGFFKKNGRKKVAAAPPNLAEIPGYRDSEIPKRRNEIP